MRDIKHELSHTGTVDLKTERLLLRKVRKEDIEDIYYKLATDKKIIDFVSWSENPSLEYTEKSVNEMLYDYENKCATYKWIIEKMDTKEILGMVLVDNYNEERLVAELDYCITADARGQGYAPEAVRRVVEYLIYDVGFFRVEAVHNMNNSASGRVMQKVGMQYEGVLRGRAISLNEEGNPGDLKMYAIIRTDLENENK